MTPEARTRSDSRQRGNLDWFVDLLVGQIGAPKSGPRRGPDYTRWQAEYGSHLADSWVEPYQLAGHHSVIQLANGRRDLDRRDVWIDGDSVCWRDAQGHRWRDHFEFDPEGNFASVETTVALEGGFQVREARPEDLPAIEAMSEHARLQMYDGTCTIDRRGTTRPFIELLGDNRVHVIEEACGDVVAVGAASTAHVRVGGSSYELFYTNHFRVHERARRLGFMAVLLSTICSTAMNRMEGTLSVANEGNEPSIKGLPAIWETAAARAILDCSEIARRPVGRTVTEADSETICRLINEAHSKQECFVPYTPVSLKDRLARSPGFYGWQSLRRSQHAVLGVWLSGEVRGYEMPKQAWSETRGLVLDYGVDRHGLDEFEELIRGAASDALEAGVTHLSLFTSEPAPVFPVVEELASRIEPYRISCSIPEPADARARGVYIDPIFA
jgi:hypothetical protein